METKPHVAINYFLKELKPPQLYRCMLDIKSWRIAEDFHKKHFDRLIREVALQAGKIQAEHRGMHENQHYVDKERRF